MMLLALIALVVAIFAAFWFVGRRIKPKGSGPQQNADEVFTGRW